MAKEEKAPKAEKRERLEYGCFTADPLIVVVMAVSAGPLVTKSL